MAFWRSQGFDDAMEALMEEIANDGSSNMEGHRGQSNLSTLQWNQNNRLSILQMWVFYLGSCWSLGSFGLQLVQWSSITTQLVVGGASGGVTGHQTKYRALRTLLDGHYYRVLVNLERMQCATKIPNSKRNTVQEKRSSCVSGMGRFCQRVIWS